MWTADELTRVRVQLLAQLRELDHVDTEGRGSGRHTPGESVEEPEADDSTVAEVLAARSAEEDVAFRVRAVEGHLRGEVTDALARLDQGRYGVCESCGKRITKERLRALPHARWCMPCARRATSAG
jgi:DnaK suppressor protein